MSGDNFNEMMCPFCCKRLQVDICQGTEPVACTYCDKLSEVSGDTLVPVVSRHRVAMNSEPRANEYVSKNV